MTSGEASGTFRAWWLGQSIQRHRAARKITAKAAAAALEIDAGMYSKYENGVHPFPMAKVSAALTLFGVNDPSERRFLGDLAFEAHLGGYWDGYAKYVHGKVVERGWVEEAAVAIDEYVVSYVPGLLQTPRYAEAIIRRAQPDDGEPVDKQVEYRITRQRVLSKDNPLVFRAVLDEAAIRRMVGGPEVMIEQLQSLLEAQERGLADWRILPFSAGEVPIPDGHTAIATMRGALRPIAWSDGAMKATYEGEPVVIQGLRSAWDASWHAALDRDESTRLVHDLMEDLDDSKARPR